MIPPPPPHQIDIYSLGVVFWEIVTGERPLRGCLRHFQVPEECSPAISALIDECMHEDPALRPSSLEVVRRLRMDMQINVDTLGRAEEAAWEAGEAGGARNGEGGDSFSSEGVALGADEPGSLGGSLRGSFVQIEVEPGGRGVREDERGVGQSDEPLGVKWSRF